MYLLYNMIKVYTAYLSHCANWPGYEGRYFINRIKHVLLVRSPNLVPVLAAK